MNRNQEFPAGSRWRSKRTGRGVLVYGEAGGIVTYRNAGAEWNTLLPVARFRAAFQRIEYPEAPKPCPTCKGTGFDQPEEIPFFDPATCPDCGGHGS